MCVTPGRPASAGLNAVAADAAVEGWSGGPEPPHAARRTPVGLQSTRTSRGTDGTARLRLWNPVAYQKKVLSNYLGETHSTVLQVGVFDGEGHRDYPVEAQACAVRVGLVEGSVAQKLAQ